MRADIKKNLLDLQYNKYLQYFTTTVILLFTYLIGVGAGFITGQVDPGSYSQLLLLGSITAAVVSLFLLMMLHFRWHMGNIIREIRKLARG
jgi:hypothetical protein